MVSLKKMKVGQAFQFYGDGVVFIRCRGGYRNGRGGPLRLIDPLWVVIPYDPAGGAA